MDIVKEFIAKMINLSGYSLSKIDRRPKDNDEILKYLKYYPDNSIKNKFFYNFGAGTFRHVCWKNIDFASEWYSESQVGSDMINYDLFSLNKLPIENDCAELVYTSHTVEHINDEASQNMFNEIYRILKPGGIFRLTTPDIDLYYLAMVNKNKDFYWWKELFSSCEVMLRTNIDKYNEYSIAQWFLFSFASHVSKISKHDMTYKFNDDEIYKIFDDNEFASALNIFTSVCTVEAQKQYPGYHMNWWNFDKAKRMLADSGFETIYKSGYTQSLSIVMRDAYFFDKQDVNESLYVEAIKK